MNRSLDIIDSVKDAIYRAIQEHCHRAWAQGKYLAVTLPSMETWPTEYSYKFRYVAPGEPTRLDEIVYRPCD